MKEKRKRGWKLKGRNGPDVLLHAAISLCLYIYMLPSLSPSLHVQWFIFREAYMTRVDKTEDHVLKLFRAYQDQWSKYAENLDKTRATGGPDSVKVHMSYIKNGWLE